MTPRELLGACLVGLLLGALLVLLTTLWTDPRAGRQDQRTPAPRPASEQVSR